MRTRKPMMYVPKEDMELSGSGGAPPDGALPGARQLGKPRTSSDRLETHRRRSRTARYAGQLAASAASAIRLLRRSCTTAATRKATPPSREMAVVTGYPIARYGRGASGRRRRRTKTARNDTTYW